ncbi:DNA-directed RNA polymerase V subunit 1-like [Tachyglossus aculeatus]|uniref:DNA-directed RNA polymerase V subunit 1-like n=1 Tax=Tachyglossus aculeatus TaxID=9261 RepID=UPI0018F6262B|nr:DNA-directed RNA polymerase V subunit 1-like [Tachyglossus aculeatus]
MQTSAAVQSPNQSISRQLNPSQSQSQGRSRSQDQSQSQGQSQDQIQSQDQSQSQSQDQSQNQDQNPLIVLREHNQAEQLQSTQDSRTVYRSQPRSIPRKRKSPRKRKRGKAKKGSPAFGKKKRTVRRRK